jgi:hypothetical protein
VAGMWWRNRQERKLERRLRQERPRPSDELVRSIRADVVSGRQRLLRAVSALPSTVLTVAALLGLVAVGGLGFATSRITNTLTHIGNNVYVPEQTTLRIDVNNAAQDQYGTTATTATTTTAPTTTAATTTHAATTTAATTTAATTTTRTTTTRTTTRTTTAKTTTAAATTTTVAVAKTTIAATGTTSVGLTFALTNPNPTTTGTTTGGTATTASGGSVAPATVTAAIPAKTFTSTPGQTVTGPVTVAAALPPTQATSQLTGQDNVAFTVTATTDDGTEIHTLGTYITFTVTAPCGFSPAVYANGGWRAMSEVPAPPTIADLGSNGDGYSVGSCDATTGTAAYSLYTAHLSTFGIVAPENIDVSQSGRKLKAAGSGKFGDSLLVKPGPPTLRFPKAPVVKNGKIAFSYYVNEQVSAYLHVLSGGKEVPILAGKSIYRGHRIRGVSRKTIHISMLRPGTALTTLAVGSLKPGSKVAVTVIDYDGNKVTRTITIK